MRNPAVPMALRCSEAIDKLPIGRRAVAAIVTVTALSASAGSPSGADAAACSGTRLSPGQDIASIVSRGANNQTFCLSAGVYRVTKSVRPRPGQALVGAPGVVLSGGGSVTDVIGGSAANVRLRDLVIERAASHGVRATGSGWVLEHVEARSNGNVGIAVQGGSRITGSHIHHNGRYGFTAQGRDVVIAGNDVSYNNAARMDTHSECWAAGGAKVWETTNLVLRDNNFHDNLCNGIWLDMNNYNSLVEGNRSVGNRGHGIVQEIGYQATIRNNTVENNAWWGIVVRSSSHTKILGNRASGNRWGAIMLFHKPRTDHPSPHGPHHTTNTEVSGNIFTLSGAADEKVGGITTGGSEAFRPGGTNRYYGNTWQLPRKGTRSFRWNGGRHDEAGWRALGQDTGGSFRVAP